MKQLIDKILKHEGVATIVTNNSKGSHVTATWNSYIAQDENGNFLFPAGGYHQTEDNIKAGSKVIMLIGSKMVEGKQGMGTGLRLTGNAIFYDKGIQFEQTKKRFSWIRAVMVITIEQVEQLL
jgi:hypothetical protein